MDVSHTTSHQTRVERAAVRNLTKPKHSKPLMPKHNHVFCPAIDKQHKHNNTKSPAGQAVIVDGLTGEWSEIHLAAAIKEALNPMSPAVNNVMTKRVSRMPRGGWYVQLQDTATTEHVARIKALTHPETKERCVNVDIHKAGSPSVARTKLEAKVASMLHYHVPSYILREVAKSESGGLKDSKAMGSCLTDLTTLPEGARIQVLNAKTGRCSVTLNTEKEA